ncbi:SDR family NAD(P)-dependent oxidoreductase [Sphingobacterium sp. 18053]|uniref:SDR family NAD(P)-dependent oxidoreductase n=1 Tax=Sphingobacterium sp. 18053 TaxID=2681401 RepID=UPI0013590003|nr:glucose 1-dehydrogenase [Sphingobacterium sp. 18053]
MKNKRQLEGKVALITGASQGLGEAAVRVLAERGASIIATDINAELGEQLIKSLQDNGTEAIFIKHNVSIEKDWVEVIKTAMDKFGKVDILVNNAGIIEFTPISEMTVEQFDKTISINVRGTFLGCKYILPAMQAAGSGSIINMSSIAGMIANTIGSTAYATSKGAVRTLTKAVALDYIEQNIRVNSVHPGGIRTPAAEPFLADPQLAPLTIGRTPMKRIGLPREVASVIAFLASEESSYMTGSELVVDGGWLAV